MISPALIDGLLDEAHAEFKKDKGSKSYQNKLSRLYKAAFPELPPDNSVKRMVKAVQRAHRTKNETLTTSISVEENARTELFESLFPYEASPAAYVRRLAFKVLYEVPSSPGMPSCAVSWTPDLKMALLADLATSIQSILFGLQSEKRDQWKDRVEEELLKRLRVLGRENAYLHSQALWKEWDQTYKEYEKLDREYNDTRALVIDLEKAGLTKKQRSKFDEDNSDSGYTLVRHTLRAKFPAIFKKFDNGQKLVRVANSRQEHAYQAAIKSESALGINLADIRQTIADLDFKKMYETGGKFMSSVSNYTWTKFVAIDYDWYNGCVSALRYAIRNQKALGIDLLLHTPGTRDRLSQKLLLRQPPLIEVEVAISQGQYLDRGVAANALVRPAIERAMRVERELVKCFLEKCGPQSPWTRYYAHAHNAGWSERRKTGNQIAALIQEFDGEVTRLVGGFPK